MVPYITAATIIVTCGSETKSLQFIFVPKVVNVVTGGSETNPDE